MNSYARGMVHRQLSALTAGQLRWREAGGEYLFGDPIADPALSATICVHRPDVYPALILGGSLGAAESYAHGDWSSDDLTAVVRVLLRNRDVLDGMESRLARLSAPLRRLLHWLNRNTRSGSRRNIRAHYDLGNEFFALFLDPTMTYSCAYFETPMQPLEQAQLAKIDRICRKLALTPGDHLLEIGTGWGALALHAARNYGCRVTTTTISPAQHRLAGERIAAAGLGDQITLLLTDYRDLAGQYDKLVSVEMIEAVGHRYFDTFFSQASRLLKPQGLMLLQSITIADQRYDSARRAVDVIQRYIFPGSTIPSITALLQSATRASDLCLVHMEDIGLHYATTLRRWREAFTAQRSEIQSLGHNETFCRLWEYYLSYCEGGFAERALGDAQMLLAKPAARLAT